MEKKQMEHYETDYKKFRYVFDLPLNIETYLFNDKLFNHINTSLFICRANVMRESSVNR